MKKSAIYLFVILSLATNAFGQIGFEGGLNMATLSLKSAGAKIPTKYKAGVSIGIISDISISQDHHIYLEPGVFYQNDGATINVKPDDWKFHLNSFTIPIFIEYKSGDKCSPRFFCGVGPYIRDNLNGYTEETYFTSSGTDKITIGTDVKEIDFGLGLNLGYLGSKHWYVRGNYLFGLADNLPGGDDKNHIKQSTGGLTIGYMIRGCRHRSWDQNARNSGRDHWRGLRKNHYSRHQIFHRPNGPAYR